MFCASEIQVVEPPAASSSSLRSGFLNGDDIGRTAFVNQGCDNAENQAVLVAVKSSPVDDVAILSHAAFSNGKPPNTDCSALHRVRRQRWGADFAVFRRHIVIVGHGSVS